MSDMTPVDQRYGVFSLRYTAANIGYSVGPLIGAWLGLTGGNGAFVFSCVTFLAYAPASYHDGADSPVNRTSFSDEPASLTG
jgi:MFS family permease